MATIIGLCLRVKLMRSLPSRYKVDIRVAPGSHATEAAGEDVIFVDLSIMHNEVFSCK
ncbi:Protein ae7 [Stylosanthes scabra]|uniref:Protein ae7 n=1 Tax=Stylosanthes scabra TaxID=79078 RepID=A0ABU6W2G4_9FABA|nr:Protein ae7 [Stylosanthes scabra]